MTGRGQFVSVWRGPLIVAAVITAVAHVPVTGDHLDEAPYIGALFIALEVVSAVVALVLLRRDSRATAAVAVLIGALAIIAYVVSRSAGLPQIEDDIGNWAEPLGVVSITAEAGMVLFGAAAMSRVGAAAVRRSVALAGSLALLIGGLAAIHVAADAESETGGDAMTTSVTTVLGSPPVTLSLGG